MESPGTTLISQRSFWDQTVGTWVKAFWNENTLRLLAVGSAIVGWWTVSSLMPVDYSVFLPGPQRVFATIVEAFQTEALGEALLGALFPMLTGYFLAIAVGIPLGILMGVSRKMERCIDPYVNGLYVAPLSAIIPAMIFWFGVGFQMRATVAFSFSVFFITINTLQGTKQTPSDFVELARSFGASRLYIFRRIVIPYAIPYIMVGLRLAMGRAIVGIVIAELLISVTGIGEIISTYSSAFRLDGVLGVALVIMTGGIVLTGLVQWLENVVAPWKKKEAAFEEQGSN
jgi:NitT/TauT family transport system permease protein